MRLSFIEETADFIFMEGSPCMADIIFVPGNGYPQMAERAAKLWKAGFAPYVLPSGKYSTAFGEFSGVLDKKEEYQGTFSTEWEFLREVLVKNGVPDYAILREDQATYTEQNARYSRRVTEHAGITVKRAMLSCKNYHARRAYLYYQQYFPNTVFHVLPSCVDGIDRNNWNKTKEGVLAVTGEVTRIIYQFSLLVED